MNESSWRGDEKRKQRKELEREAEKTLRGREREQRELTQDTTANRSGCVRACVCVSAKTKPSRDEE